jgi:hypothetical protein
MKYETHEVDDFTFMQPKNLLTEEDEHDLAWKALVITFVLIAVAIFNIERWGVVDAVFDLLA